MQLRYMERALALADLAQGQGEVPVGAVIVLNDHIIGEGFNSPISDQDPTAHAEINALRQASRKIQNYRLQGADLYVTIEPCTMCVGALVHARIGHLYYGAAEPKAGAVKSACSLIDSPWFNHRVQVTSGLLEDPCRLRIQSFFKERRG